MTRTTCPQCLRPVCVCHLVVPFEPRTVVTVLQHPLEVRHSKNTARLLHLCLGNSSLAVGEAFSALEQQTWLLPRRQAVLLYPPGPDNTVLSPADCQPEVTQLIVLDGTWRKTRKMLHLNPQLAALPRLALDSPLSSAYRLRKAHASHQLSTLEAVAEALTALEGQRFQGLHQVMKGFVEHQLSLRP